MISRGTPFSDLDLHQKVKGPEQLKKKHILTPEIERTEHVTFKYDINFDRKVKLQGFQKYGFP